jgi:hypothetical protein
MIASEPPFVPSMFRWIIAVIVLIATLAWAGSA